MLNHHKGVTSNMNFTLHVWRQKNSQDKGRFVCYEAKNISPHCSFLEMLDQVNEELILKGEDPIAFDHDCREGICGMCSQVINGQAHGHLKSTTVCQLHMRHFNDGDHIWIEPWRAKAFPIIKDLIVDRSALDAIIQAGGFISVNTGGAPDANIIAIPKHLAEKAFDAAACIGCGACVASCPNASAMLFLSAKIAHLSLLPQGHPERQKRILSMIEKMDQLGFGKCSNTYECEAKCPKNIKKDVIAKTNREFLYASLLNED